MLFPSDNFSVAAYRCVLSLSESVRSANGATLRTITDDIVVLRVIVMRGIIG